MTAAKATFVETVDNGSDDVDQLLWRVEPPMQGWDVDNRPLVFDFVVTSATDAQFSGPETYIFGADKTGEVVDWLELPGSFKGSLDHDAAITNAGYEVVR